MKTLVQQYLKYDPAPPPVLYHYCSVQVLLGIIENSCIWLCDASKTNDITETRWLFSSIRRIFEQVIFSFHDEFDATLIVQTAKIAYSIIDNFDLYKVPIVQSAKNYLACFSENGDLLSQWRAYGNNGKGVAIGFNPKCFLVFQNRYDHEFTKVIYDQEKTEYFLKRVISEHLKYCILDYIEGMKEDRENNHEQLATQIALLIHSIYQEGFLFKNPFFCEEQEWRLYRKIDRNNFNDSDGQDDYGYAEFLEGIFVDNAKSIGDFSRSKLKFRDTDHDIRSYMEIGFERYKKEIISEITLGPKCTINPFDLKLLLLKNGYIDDILSEAVNIKQSMAPYT